MNTLLDLGSCILAAEHIVKADFTMGRKGGEPYLDEDTGQMATTEPRQAKMDLTLTSVHLASDELGYSAPLPVAASVSDHLILYGSIAEELAIWMQDHAVIVTLEAHRP